MDDAFRRCLEAPRGLVIVSGQMDSGMEARIYDGIRALVASGRSVTSIENPIESRLDGVRQIGLRGPQGFHFSQAIDFALEDEPPPDVLVVGLITDRTSLEQMIAFASRRLVIAGFYAGSAASVPGRLEEMVGYPVTCLHGVSSTYEE